VNGNLKNPLLTQQIPKLRLIEVANRLEIVAKNEGYNIAVEALVAAGHVFKFGA
jgi:hypothetical protein